MTFIWTDQRDKELRQHFAKHGSAGELAAKWRVSRNVIAGRKHRLRIKGGKVLPGRPYTDNEVATLIALRRSGKKIREIAKSLHRDWKCLAVKLSKLGVVRMKQQDRLSA